LLHRAHPDQGGRLPRGGLHTCRKKHTRSDIRREIMTLSNRGAVRQACDVKIPDKFARGQRTMRAASDQSGSADARQPVL
jgi:hypothetical protein